MDGYRDNETFFSAKILENSFLESVKGKSVNGTSDILLDVIYGDPDKEKEAISREETVNGKENTSDVSTEEDSDSVDSEPTDGEVDEVDKESVTTKETEPEPDSETPVIVENGESSREQEVGEEKPPPAKKKRTRKKKSGEGKSEKGTKKKRKSKKAHMRRNLKETTLKELNPQTFSAHSEELERMLRIGQVDNFPLNSDSRTSELPPSIMALLNRASEQEERKGEHKAMDSSFIEQKSAVVEAQPPSQHSSVHRPSVATFGEPSSSAKDDYGCHRVHKEASSEQSRTGLVDNSCVIVLDDSDTDPEQESTKTTVQPTQSKTSLQGSKPMDWKKKYLGLDLIGSESALGRDPSKVLINPGHPSSEPDVCPAPQIAISAKLHQIGGMRFLYDNIVESVERFKNSNGFGCILAHSMGLGKTLQAIGFTDLFLRYTPSKHVLIMVPVNTMMNWLAEFEQWLPSSKEIPLSKDSSTVPPTSVTEKQGDASTLPRSFPVFALSDSMKTMVARFAVIKEWREKGGVLLIGYEMYRMLSMSVPSIAGNKMAVKKKRRKKKIVEVNSGVIDLDETEKEMQELIEIQEALCKPGPDLVICDEGHRIRNENTNLSQALKLIRTKRRVVMTGYPLQNNLLEYWCMVDFVRPNYLGDRKEFQTLFERPITNGQCTDSLPEDVRLMRRRCHVLYQSLQGFVLRCDHSILKCSLPPKYECVLYLRPSAVQKKLYDYVYECAKTTSTNGINPIVAFSTFSKIWNHPEIFHEACGNSKSGKTGGNLSDIDIPQKEKEVPLLADWPADVTDYQPMSLDSSSKFIVLMSILDFTIAMGEKLLVFSQSLSTLSLIEKFLGTRCIPKPSLSQSGTIEYTDKTWKKGLNYYRLDGSTSMSERENMIDSFNSPKNSKCWLFLLSTRAGCLGINLVAANRVVVVDVSWNPCHDAQAVCRVYRFGQRRPTHIYRLVLDGTMERKMYQRQISKQGMSDRVVDELNPERNLARSDIESLVEPPEDLPEFQNFSEDIGKFSYDVILMSLCHHFGHILTKVPFEHESLLLDQDDDKLSETEKMEAIKDFQTERDRSRRTAVYAVPGQSSASVHKPTPTTQPAKVQYNDYMMSFAAKQKETQRFPTAPNVSHSYVGSASSHGSNHHLVSGSYSAGLSSSSPHTIPPPVNGFITPSFASNSSSSWPQVTIQPHQQDRFGRYTRHPGPVQGGSPQGQSLPYGSGPSLQTYSSSGPHGPGILGSNTSESMSQDISFGSSFLPHGTEQWSNTGALQPQVTNGGAQHFQQPSSLLSAEQTAPIDVEDMVSILSSDDSFLSPSHGGGASTATPLPPNDNRMDLSGPNDVQELMDSLFP